MRAQRFLGLSLLVGAIAFLRIISVGNAAVITVDDDGPADFASIRKAIDAAKNGDVIRIAAGRYEERITLKKNITIQGAGANLTVIALPANDRKEQPIILAENVTAGALDSFSIDGRPQINGIGLSSSSLRISDITIINANIAIDIRGGNRSTISNNEIRKCNRAISCTNSKNVTISDNTIATNQFGIGILLVRVLFSTVEKNKITAPYGDGIRMLEASAVINRNEIAQARKGIKLHDTQNQSVILKNNIIKNGIPGSIGIDAFNSSATIRGNLITRNGCGISVNSQIDLGTKEDYGKNSIYDNTVAAICNDSPGEIMAVGNYWGSRVPRDIDFDNRRGGKIVYKPWLKEDESLSWGVGQFVKPAWKIITMWGKIKNG